MIITDENRTSSLGLLNLSKDYLKAYKILELNKEYKKGFSRDIKHFLLCHAIELSLKAYLKSEKFSLIKLKKIGHNLEQLLSECEMKDISKYIIFSADNHTSIKMLNSHYKIKEYEYPVIGLRTDPVNVDDMYIIFNKMTRLLAKKCFDSTYNSEREE